VQYVPERVVEYFPERIITAAQVSSVVDTGLRRAGLLADRDRRAHGAGARVLPASWLNYCKRPANTR
jgi:hypothetical protein